MREETTTAHSENSQVTQILATAAEEAVFRRDRSRAYLAGGVGLMGRNRGHGSMRIESRIKSRRIRKIVVGLSLSFQQGLLFLGK